LTVSSGSLYNPNAALPLTEISEILPSSPYAVSKLGQEQIAQYYTIRGFDSIIARPFNHIGPGQSEGFLVPDIAKQISLIEKGRSSKLSVGNLEARRDYTDVRDIARAYRLLIEKGKSNEIYNVCSGKSWSGQEILDKLVVYSKTSVEAMKDPSRMRPSDAPDIYGSYEKTTRDTGWRPEINIDQTLLEALEDWRSRS
jgi:GDP-4-dehydro-6-deoxy-D-mannose reductase